MIRMQSKVLLNEIIKSLKRNKNEKKKIQLENLIRNKKRKKRKKK